MTSIVSSLFYRSMNTLDTIVGSSRNRRQDLTPLNTRGLPSSHSVHSAPPFTQDEVPPAYNNWLLSGNTKVYRKGISSSIKLLEVAADEFDGGNEEIALDIYLAGLEKIIMSLPNLKDRTTKQALREKLISLEKRVGIVSNLQVNNNQQMKLIDQVSTSSNTLINRFLTLSNILMSSSSSEDKQIKQSDSLSKLKQVGRVMTEFIIQCVILFKQSPLPGLLYILFSYFAQLILWIDRYTRFSEKLQRVGISCIKQLLKADEKYHLHELASETLFTFVSASLKALVAYQEAPGYNDSTIQATADKKVWTWSRSFSAATMTM
ncbi:hypothetical protein EDC94DRAFT_592803 [Helicostylum pulchrum]|nr:hypothetical protein EDC94DRAFT_592803 [Helicostylum pulchrum]